MIAHDVVDHVAWIEARKALLAREKEFTRLRDELSALRRGLPWERVESDYRFDGPGGQQSLPELFDGRSQLIVYHFMLGADWEAGCKSCSFWADSFDGIDLHLVHRDATFLAVSRAPWPKIAAYRKRMGWRFKWVSSDGSNFNFDYQVSFTREQLASGKVFYNYAFGNNTMSELPGLSVFCREGGEVFHTYSCYARGLDALNVAYQLLDLAPKGRDEAGLPSTMSWLRRHDEYTR
jgi:predicted dithiol-disulfide oxidoreductase (DUF899 family)